MTTPTTTSAAHPGTCAHTPGPWRIHDNIGRKGELGILADAAPCIITVMGNAKEWPLEAQANARLIAAAPELLAALQSVARVFVGWQHDANPHGDLKRGESADYDAATTMLEMVRAAITKATA